MPFSIDLAVWMDISWESDQRPIFIEHPPVGTRPHKTGLEASRAVRDYQRSPESVLRSNLILMSFSPLGMVFTAGSGWIRTGLAGSAGKLRRWRAEGDIGASDGWMVGFGLILFPLPTIFTLLSHRVF
jgi:hypothetical protein